MDNQKLYLNPQSREVLPSIGKEAKDTILIVETISLKLKSGELNDPSLIFAHLKNFIESLDTKDPNQVHFDVVRSAIKKINKNLLEENTVIDRLARSLIDYCKTLKIKFNKEQATEKDELFTWDLIFLETLSSIGDEGQKAREEIEEICFNNVKRLKDVQENPLSFWFNINASSDEPFHLSPALQTIIQVIWEQEHKSRFSFAKNNPAGVTTNVSIPISQMLSSSTKYHKTNELIKFHNKENHLLGSISLITINPTILHYILMGVKELHSLTAIRLMLFFIKETYKQFIDGNRDYFELKYPGRARQIANELGLKNNNEITKINSLIHVLDNLKFDGPEITSRLINLGECKSTKFSPKGGWLISVLSPLRPYRIFEEKGGFIIPLLKDPPLVSHKKYHARQFILQWKIAEEFSKQSAFLAANGYIKIEKEKWHELLFACDLPLNLFEKIHEAWTGKENFLEMCDADCYTLKNEDRALKFLVDQGNLRVSQSKRGRTSAKNKKLKSQKKKLK